jgi:hypothetical protein
MLLQKSELISRILENLRRGREHDRTGGVRGMGLGWRAKERKGL